MLVRKFNACKQWLEREVYNHVIALDVVACYKFLYEIKVFKAIAKYCN
jgi:hypothetical protein